MKKITLCFYIVFYGLVFLLLGTYMFNNFIPTKPFRFEDFKTQAKAQDYFNKHYPIGSDVTTLLNDLKKVGVENIDEREGKDPGTEKFYKMRKNKENLKYDKIYTVRYYNNYISEDPRGFYILGIFTLQNGSITDILVDRWYKF